MRSDSISHSENYPR
jgi:hypothetical protein